MAEVTNDLICEELKDVQGDVAILKRDVLDLKGGMPALEIAVGHLQTSIGQLNGRVDTMDCGSTVSKRGRA
ncbi:hypothetical protein D6850_11745 [Roseovarius spongiae]|uniref:Uncharacterized protein n=1 Tax=Roseovarius spongiae TaxID=2320272 RepID=A0A3A8AUR7_9RHOB|nr:hypothetical protein [Roseovarius spongiae]RKF13863.1 hypothetical protein D6850_11745 [Roseovarius spongiae]